MEEAKKVSVSTSTRIVVNGRKYDSVEDMPPADRETYRRMMEVVGDRDGNGVPDVLEGGTARPGTLQFEPQSERRTFTLEQLLLAILAGAVIGAAVVVAVMTIAGG